MSVHTETPWNLHPSYNGKPFAVDPGDLGGEGWDSAHLYIAKGTKIIAQVEMMTGTRGGFPRVNNEAEMRGNADLILRAVNAHDELLAVAKSILDDATGQPDDLGQRRWPIRAENYRQLTAAIALAKEPAP